VSSSPSRLSLAVLVAETMGGKEESLRSSFKLLVGTVHLKTAGRPHQLLAGIVHAVATHVVVYDVSDTVINLT
jgi:hypothetical protein